jgi:hypothetical protein
MVRKLKRRRDSTMSKKAIKELEQTLEIMKKYEDHVPPAPETVNFTRLLTIVSFTSAESMMMAKLGPLYSTKQLNYW